MHVQMEPGCQGHMEDPAERYEKLSEHYREGWDEENNALEARRRNMRTT